MKSVVKEIINYIVKIANIIYPYSLCLKFRQYRDFIYTLWIKNNIGKAGKNVSFNKPAFLEGDGLEFVSIGENVRFHANFVLGCRQTYGNKKFMPSVMIGNNCDFGEYNHISAVNKVVVGDGFLSGRFVLITDNSHGSSSLQESQIPPAKRELVSKGEIIIGKNVWLGDKVVVLANVHIGDNVIVAANSVVTKDVPSNCVIAGIPARVIKEIK